MVIPIMRSFDVETKDPKKSGNNNIKQDSNSCLTAAMKALIDLPLLNSDTGEAKLE